MFAALQNAGTQLKSLQKALKNPLGNAGLLAGEITKRAKRLQHILHRVSPFLLLELLVAAIKAAAVDAVR